MMQKKNTCLNHCDLSQCYGVILTKNGHFNNNTSKIKKK